MCESVWERQYIAVALLFVVVIVCHPILQLSVGSCLVFTATEEKYISRSCTTWSLRQRWLSALCERHKLELCYASVLLFILCA